MGGRGSGGSASVAGGDQQQQQHPPNYTKTTGGANLRSQYQYYSPSVGSPSYSSDVGPPNPPRGSARPTNNSSGRRALEIETKRRSSMASIVLKSLSILLGIFFIFVGTTKLTPRISKELYKELRKEFARYAKVFPLAQTLQFKIPSKWYRRGVGALEVLCGICLTFIPSQRVKQGANLVLVLMMLFATFNHWMVGDKFERIAPSLVFFFMLTCRLIVEFQMKRKARMDEKEKAEKLEKQQQPQQAAGKEASQAAPPAAEGKGKQAAGKESKGRGAKKDD